MLILQDGIRTGSLSSQSGDHGELYNVLSFSRLEVVKGPATLLYGSTALGEVVKPLPATIMCTSRPPKACEDIYPPSAVIVWPILGDQALTGYESDQEQSGNNGKWYDAAHERPSFSFGIDLPFEGSPNKTVIYKQNGH